MTYPIEARLTCGPIAVQLEQLKGGAWTWELEVEGCSSSQSYDKQRATDDVLGALEEVAGAAIALCDQVDPPGACRLPRYVEGRDLQAALDHLAVLTALALGHVGSGLQGSAVAAARAFLLPYGSPTVTGGEMAGGPPYAVTWITGAAR